MNSSSSKLEYFEAFVSEFVVGKIAFKTNRYAHQYLLNCRSNEIPIAKSLKRKDTNIGELYTFLAATILMARNKKLEIKEYWSTDPLLNTPIFGQIMSRDRYLLLLQMIHFCNNENQKTGDRLFELDVVLDEIRNNFRAGMVPFQTLVILTKS